MNGKVAIVTGARRGIGKTIALRLVRDEAKVAVSDVSKEDCELVVREIKQLGGKGLALKLDVTSGEEIKEAMQKLVQLTEKHKDNFREFYGILMGLKIAYEDKKDSKIKGEFKKKSSSVIKAFERDLGIKLQEEEANF